MTVRASRDCQEAANRGRHQKFCTVCKRSECQEIERDFIDWQSPAEIAKSLEFAVVVILTLARGLAEHRRLQPDRRHPADGRRKTRGLSRSDRGLLCWAERRA